MQDPRKEEMPPADQQNEAYQVRGAELCECLLHLHRFWDKPRIEPKAKRLSIGAHHLLPHGSGRL